MEYSANLEYIKNRVKESNINASKNRNLYPIQEQATLMEIWEYAPCRCNINCTCKKFGCTHHWKLKENLTFDDILPAFVRMFADKGLHNRLLGWINGTISIPDNVPKRAQGALLILQNLRDNWHKLYAESLRHNKTLICDDWYTDFWRKQWDFPVKGVSVYESKQFCILLPDICSPYDTRSLNKILNRSNIATITYFEMLDNLRDYVTNILIHENQILSNFRKLDSPQEQLPFNNNLISLRKNNFAYGNTYAPDERPISRVIDKYFYQPSSGETGRYKEVQSSVTPNGQILYPLSGSGKPISWQNYNGMRRVSWGNGRFDLSDDLVDDILDNYFKDFETWYPLGASMTDPKSDGLGIYIQKNFSPLTPRHASAIAAIMVQENLIEFRGKRPIELRKLNIK